VTITSESLKTGVSSTPSVPVNVIVSVAEPALKFQVPVPTTLLPKLNAAAVTSSAPYAPAVFIGKPATPVMGPRKKSSRSTQCDPRSKSRPAPAIAGSNRQFERSVVARGLVTATCTDVTRPIAFADNRSRTMMNRGSARR
jgi:hypothetical protein